MEDNVTDSGYRQLKRVLTDMATWTILEISLRKGFFFSEVSCFLGFLRQFVRSFRQNILDIGEGDAFEGRDINTEKCRKY